MSWNWLSRRTLKKSFPISIEEARKRLAEIEINFQQLEEKWKSFERLAMVAKGEEVSSQEEHELAVDDFWDWVNLTNNKRILIDLLSKEKP